MSVVLFIAVLVVLIVVHEFGHFIVAKFFGIKVKEFGVGYPPRAFILKKIGETVYTVNWLPFGGFVKIFGESRDQNYSVEDKKRAFSQKSKLVQAAVLSSGVIFNLIFAWLLFSITLLSGAPTAVEEANASEFDTRLILSAIISDSPADQVGLKSGDELVSITSGGTSVELLPSLASEFIQENAGKEITVEYIRSSEGEEIESVSLIPAHGVISESPGVPAVGVAMALIADQPLSLGASISKGFTTTAVMFKTVTIGLGAFLWAAITGAADWSSVAGPIGIAELVGDASSVGFIYLLYFTAFISVNLAVINLIPLPALDGGRLFFIAVEAITRKQINSKIANTLTYLAFHF